MNAPDIATHSQPPFDQSSPQALLSQVNTGPIAGRTRHRSANLNAHVRELSSEEVFNSIKTTKVNSVLRVKLADAPAWVETSHTGRVIALNGRSRLVEFDTIGQRMIPIDKASSTITTSVEVVKHHTLQVPINQSNRPIEPTRNHPVICCDGGCRPNPGAGGSGIRVFIHRDGNVDVKSHSRYYTWATNNITEAIVLVASLRLAVKLLEDSVAEHIVIVTDSQICYNMVTQFAALKKGAKELVPIIEEARTILLAHAGHITLAHMLRSFTNPADEVATRAIHRAEGEGQTSLFMDIPILPARKRVAAPVAPTLVEEVVNMTFGVPKSLADFASLRRFKSRGTVPDSCAHLWAHLVDQQLTKILEAPNDKKEEEILRFLMMPTVFLPRSASTTRIVRHMQENTPFHVEFDNPRPGNRRERTVDATSDARLGEAIHRHISDGKLRTANRMLVAMAEADDMSFEQKVEGMKKKIIGDTGFKTKVERKNVPMFSTSEIVTALRKQNKQAATAVDGWTRQLIESAVNVNIDVATKIGQLLHFIITAPISELLRQMFTLSRGVAIPKPDMSGIRPICISAIFSKMLGCLATERDGILPSCAQFAIGPKEGAKRVIHKVRQRLRRDPRAACLRYDMSNAYGALLRDILDKLMNGREETFRQYFRLHYGLSTSVCIYGTDNQRQFIALGQGVKQGDSTSSLLFCLACDVALGMLNEQLRKDGIAAEIYMYMDDLTICCDATHVNAITRAVVAAFATINLKVNESKSKVLTAVDGHYDLPRCTHMNEFILLGANVANDDGSYSEYTLRLLRRQENYFNLLNRIRLHPAATMSLLRICGFPRIMYFCCTTPSKFIRPVAMEFDALVKRTAESVLDPTGQIVLDKRIVHDKSGIGAPNYTMHCEELYNAYQRMSLTDDPEVPVLPLTTSDITTEDTLAQIDSQWLYYDATNPMTPAQFVTALCIRLNVVPPHMQLGGTRCNCGHVYVQAKPAETINHIMCCEKSTGRSFTYRHNLVRDAILQVARNFGITSSKEPSCFSYDNGHARPDIYCHTHPRGLVTDVVLASRYPSEEAVTAWEQRKISIHREAVNKSDCIFIPFAMATRGTIGAKAVNFIRELSRAVQPFQQRAFVRTMYHAVATAAAIGRAGSLASAADRLRW